MTREKMLELLALLNPASAKALTLAGITDEQLEFALFHEGRHIAAARNRFNAEMDKQIEAIIGFHFN